MSAEISAVRVVKFERFLPPESPRVQDRTQRLFGCLTSKLLRPHTEFVENVIRRMPIFRSILENILSVDFEGITDFRSFEEMMAEVDSKPEGRILDEADAILRQIHREIRQAELTADFSLMGFFKQEPRASADYEDAKLGEPNFDPAEVIARTLMVVDNMVSTGKKYGVFPQRKDTLEQRFIWGYTFLRTAEILSRRV